MNARFAHVLPFGAEIIATDRVRFRLWAPDLETLALEIEGAAALPMRRDAAGWFEGEATARAGSKYRYRIAAESTVPDPASRLQCDDVHGWSVVCDPREFVWRHAQWRGRPWKEAIIYELHVGCCGGFSGVEQRLRELAQLGITAIELMPIADFYGARNWGYDGVLPFAPDAAYGTPAQLKHLIDSAHDLGLCVYLDVVYNHFGPTGNYLHAYASAFFEREKSSGWGAAIDFSQPQVREFFTQNALYWLHEYRFDGLRFDAVHAIGDPLWLDEMAATVRASAEPDRHIHLMLENENNRAQHLAGTFDAQWNDDWHNVVHVLLTGEHEGYYANYTEEPTQRLARSLAEGFIYQGEPSPTHRGKPRGSPSAYLPPTAFINFLQNHDQIGNRAFGERLTTLAQKSNLHAAIALQLLSPQIPLLFMGEEWGARTPFLFFTAFDGELSEAVREGRRKEFAAFEVFQDAQRRAHIPDPNALETFTASIPDFSAAILPEQRGTLTFYRELLQLRHQHIVPRLHDCRSSGARAVADAAVVAGWQFGDGAQLQIAVNFSATAIAIEPLSASLLFECGEGSGAAAAAGKLLAHCAIATLAEQGRAGHDG
ncbi:MAG TPA: malto-oligosyltrehalose trehalohydrolase [Spongiibacteraceae bacterium]|jgi:malto-oligosyltrehalose trehalohydrolase